MGVNLKVFIHQFKDGNHHITSNESNDDSSSKDYDTSIIEIDHTDTFNILPNLSISTDSITSLVLTRAHLCHLPDISLCSNLIELDISYNRFRTVPDSLLHNNPKIQILNLSRNYIGNFNSIPKCCTKLRNLNISQNNIVDVPFWIFSSSCPELEILDISHNPLQTILPFLTGQCLKNLSTLKMDNCNFTKNFVKFIQEIPSLKVLSIKNFFERDFLNSVQHLPLDTFASVRTITELNLSGLGFSALPEEICAMNALEILDISYNHLSWLPEKFSVLKSLRVLNASHNEILYLPKDIGEMINLNELHFAYNVIGSLPDSMINLTKLQLIDCYYNDFIESILKVIDKIPSIEAIDLEQNYFDVNQSAEYVAKREKIRCNCKSRSIGPRQLMDTSDDEVKDCSYTNSVSGDEYECNEDSEVEENWDIDEKKDDYIDDDDAMLILPIFHHRLIRKPRIYDPSDYIDPVCFEDAISDET